jgi:hypothetical protein
VTKCSRVLGAVGRLAGGLLWFLVMYVVAAIAARHLVAAALVSLASVAAFSFGIWARFTARGRASIQWQATQDFFGTCALLLALTAICTGGFSALSAALYDVGIGRMHGRVVSGLDTVNASYLYYLWHFAKAIPLLDVPETLNWKLKHPFTDSINGALALIYVVLVVSPLLYLAAEVIAPRTGDDESAADGRQQPPG